MTTLHDRYQPCRRPPRRPLSFWDVLFIGLACLAIIVVACEPTTPTHERCESWHLARRTLYIPLPYGRRLPFPITNVVCDSERHP